MGYGLLFIACILLMNFTHFAYTDMICALLLTMGFVRLSPLQREYRVAEYASLAAVAGGAAELVSAALELIGVSAPAWLMPCLAMARAALFGTITVLMLLGIRKTAAEVGLGRLAVRCESTVVMPVILYSATFILEIPGLIPDTAAGGAAIAAALVILLSFVMHILNAVTVYTAYARICMPSDVTMEQKPSRFAFVNRMRAESARRESERRAEAQALYEERMKKKKSKRKKK